MEYRTTSLSRWLQAFVGIAVNFAILIASSQFDFRTPLFFLMLIVIDFLVAHAILEDSRILLFSDRMELYKGYLVFKPDPGKFEIRFSSITRIKCVRGNRGGPKFVIYFSTQGKDDTVTIHNGEVRDVEGLIEELSRRARVTVETGWFF